MKNFNAIRDIYPNAIFSMIDDDLQKITWVGQEYPIPTQEEIDEFIKNKEIDDAKKNTDKQIAKAAALKKLKLLGLTEEEIQAIVGA